MFSGIIEEMGLVVSRRKSGRTSRLIIRARQVWEDTKIGDSVAVNGVCLTVVKKEDGLLHFDLMPETEQKTNLGTVSLNAKVNLERSLKVGERVSGHFLLGHIDCMGAVRSRRMTSGNLGFTIAIPSQYMSYIYPQGPVAVDGISLTVVSVKSDTFSVYIIPHTLESTNLSLRYPAERVNVEVDFLGKQAVRFLQTAHPPYPRPRH